MATISLCMIVRDAESVLRACLESVRGVFDQTIIVDTGSQDRTIEIAKEFGAETYEVPWADSFSVARNESIRHAKMDWILWLDADDTLPSSSAKAIRDTVNRATERQIAFILPVQGVRPDEAQGTRVYHIKLFRNLPGVQFERRVHEQVLPSLQALGGNIGRINAAMVLHSGYDRSAAGQEAKRARDRRLLLLDLKEQPGDAFTLFNLGATEYQAESYRAAIDWLQKCVKVSHKAGSHLPRAYALLGLAHHRIGANDKALLAFDAGIAAVGPHPTLLFDSATVLAHVSRFRDARLRLLAISEDTSWSPDSFDPAIFGTRRSFLLGVVSQELGRHRDARQHYLDVLRLEPGHIRAAIALFNVARTQGDGETMSLAVDAVSNSQGYSEVWAELEMERLTAAGADAERSMREMIDSNPDAIGPIYCVVKYLLDRAEYDEAEPLLKRLNALGHAQSAYVLGLIAESDGESDAARSWFERATTLDPCHEDAQSKLVRDSS